MAGRTYSVYHPTAMDLRYFCFFGLLLSGTTSSNGEVFQKNLGQDQQETVHLWNTLFDSNFTISGDQFSSQFRPPSASKESPEPTIVDVSLKKVQVISHGYAGFGSSYSLVLQGVFVIEYLDKRLTYEPINKLQKYLKIPVPYKTEPQMLNECTGFKNSGLWVPAIEIRDDMNLYQTRGTRHPYGGYEVQAHGLSRLLFHNTESTTIHHAKSFVTPQGHVYMETMTTPLILQAHVNTSGVYSLKLVETQNSVEEVQIRWRAKDPVTFVDGFIEIDEDGNMETYLVSFSSETCKEVESFGDQIGQVEYSCAKIVLNLSKSNSSTS